MDEPTPVENRSNVNRHAFAEIQLAYRPVVMRGLVREWPAVAAAREGTEAVAHYLSAFDNGNPTEVMVGPPEIAGRFFYRNDMRGFNFRREQAPMAAVVGELLRLMSDPNPPAIYAGAAATDGHLPGWSDANPSPFALARVTPRVWVGNATHVSTHFDQSPNLACVVAGRRRILLFPPDQIANLYIGPIDVTMAGQPASMVDPDAPDLSRYPRFAEAMRHALVAELEPGDAIFIPSLWWHNIRASGPFNVLVNYWWDQDGQTSPLAALAHGLLSIRDLPPGERATWRAWFDHYVFSDDAPGVADHLPDYSRGVLGPPGSDRSNRLKRFLRNVFQSR